MQFEAPARRADVGEAGRRARGRRGDAPARGADGGLRRRRLGAQQQGGQAALLGGQRQAAAGGRIGGAAPLHRQQRWP